MTNDISETNLEDAVPCFALSKNDSYVMSANGGRISLFNMMTFKVRTSLTDADFIVPHLFGPRIFFCFLAFCM